MKIPFKAKFALASAGALLLLGGCGYLSSANSSGPAPAPAAAEKRQYPVRTTVVSVQALKYELQALGEIEAQDVYRVDARVPGTIYDVSFNEGDEVARDKVLCRIAPEAYRLNAAKAEALYHKAVANLADAKRRHINDIDRAKINLTEANVEVTRRKTIKEAGAISEEEIQLFQAKADLAAVDLTDKKQAAETEVTVLEATVTETEAQWKIALDDVRKSTVLPPIDGIIDNRKITNGMYVTAGTPLAAIVDRRTLKLRFKLSEKDSSAVQAGNKVTFSVPAWPGREFEAEVYHVAVQADPVARVVECLARVVKDAEKLKPGYFASVRLTTGGNEQAVIVPALALLPTEKGFVSYVVIDGKAVQRFVKVGMTVTNNSIEILSGVKAGETLVVEGGNALADGSPVKILPPDTKPGNTMEAESGAAAAAPLTQNEKSTGAGGGRPE